MHLAAQCSLLVVLSGSTCEGKVSTNISKERDTHTLTKDLLVVQPEEPLVR